MSRPPAASGREPPVALVWRRTDFSESSRVVTLITRDQGRVNALAKGAHRSKSPFLGRLDHLNLVRPSFARQRTEGTLRLLRGVELLHEPRALREPRRFLAAQYLAEIFDVVMTEGRPDPELFDLLSGALLVLERCRPAGIPAAVVGVELRFLRGLGLLPPLSKCSACGAGAERLFLAGHGFACAAHRDPQAPPVAAATRRWLRTSLETAARSWASVPPPDRAVRALAGRWVAVAIERVPRLRSAALGAPASASLPAGARIRQGAS